MVSVLKADSLALLTRPPLSISTPFDLHVLSRPPAFILSQDQTLRVVEFFFGYHQVLSTQPLSWFFSLDFFLVICDIEYQLSLLLSILIFLTRLIVL